MAVAAHYLAGPAMGSIIFVLDFTVEAFFNGKIF
jgi:hypothetical protein